MRDILIIVVACLIAIGVGAWLFLSDAKDIAESGTVQFSVIAEGQHSGAITERKNYRIKDRNELDKLWQMMYVSDGPPLPDIDFTQNEVLAVFDGTHTTGGYGIDVVSVTDDGLVREVTIRHIESGEGCMTTEAITSPFEFIVLPKSNSSITRDERSEVIACE